MVKLSDLRTREVINVLDGKKLGNIIDIELDVERGERLCTARAGKGWSVFSAVKRLSFTGKNWNRSDIILVEISTFSKWIKTQGTIPDDDDNFWPQSVPVVDYQFIVHNDCRTATGFESAELPVVLR